MISGGKPGLGRSNWRMGDLAKAGRGLPPPWRLPPYGPEAYTPDPYDPAISPRLNTTLADLAECGLRAASHSAGIVVVEAARRGRGWLV